MSESARDLSREIYLPSVIFIIKRNYEIIYFTFLFSLLKIIKNFK